MLTIRAMATLGPWSLTHVDVLDGLNEQCQRCSERIRFVWVMELRREGRDPEVWRIGSKCGPTLEGVSQELWDRGAKPVARRCRLAMKIEALKARPGFGGEGEESVARILTERFTKLLDGTLTERELKHLGGVTGAMSKRLKVSKVSKK